MSNTKRFEFFFNPLCSFDSSTVSITIFESHYWRVSNEPLLPLFLN